jgi:hypothetical protein
MKAKIIVCLVFVTFLFACKKESTRTQEEETRALEELTLRIMEMTDVECTDASQWAYTAFGTKACGGPQRYIAYPNSINTTYFLNLVRDHKRTTRQYNQRWGLISDCMVVGPPKSIICENGKAVLEY